MIEIDFLWVGEETKTGDAIGCHFTHPQTGENVVVLIDGGFVETGDRIVDHVQGYYNTSTVDLVICTHPDDDHIKGLFTVLEKLDVRRLLIHRPSQYGFVGDEYKSPLVEDLVATAIANNTAVDSGFAGTSYFGGALTIAGPTETDYTAFLSDHAVWDSTANQVARALFEKAGTVKRALRSLFYDPGETLTDDNGGTSPRNNTSIICNLAVDGYRVLFTGDAGAPALTAAADYLDSAALSGKDIDLFDVPHHGSRHNLTKDLCDRLLGPVVGEVHKGGAYVTVGKKTKDHPRPEVANALKRRGYPVFEVRGQIVCWQQNAPHRLGWGPATSLNWLDESD